MGILLPALNKVRRSATSLISSNNQKNILNAVLIYANDNNTKFPESVATLGSGTRWSWREPTVLVGFQKRSPVFYRSVGQYLNGYIDDASLIFCPSAPSKYKYAKDVWVAGDAWNSPSAQTAVEDALFGNYCFYWNYIGYLSETKSVFYGPRSAAWGKNESKLLISDYFGYGHWRNELTYGTRQAYGSCEKIQKGSVTKGTDVACDFWSLVNSENNRTPGSISLNLRAGYADGHVQTYTPLDTKIMKISMTPEGRVPYPDNIGPGGTFYMPRD